MCKTHLVDPREPPDDRGGVHLLDMRDPPAGGGGRVGAPDEGPPPRFRWCRVAAPGPGFTLSFLVREKRNYYYIEKVNGKKI